MSGAYIFSWRMREKSRGGDGSLILAAGGPHRRLHRQVAGSKLILGGAEGDAAALQIGGDGAGGPGTVDQRWLLLPLRQLGGLLQGGGLKGNHRVRPPGLEGGVQGLRQAVSAGEGAQIHRPARLLQHPGGLGQPPGYPGAARRTVHQNGLASLRHAVEGGQPQRLAQRGVVHRDARLRPAVRHVRLHGDHRGVGGGRLYGVRQVRGVRGNQHHRIGAALHLPGKQAALLLRAVGLTQGEKAQLGPQVGGGLLHALSGRRPASAVRLPDDD